MHVPESTTLFGFPVHLVNLTTGRAKVEQAILEGLRFHVVTLNPEMLMQGEQDETLALILKSAGLVLPDGAGVVWALKRRGVKVERVPGIEFAEHLLKWASHVGYPVALVGATEETLTAAKETLQQRYPSLPIAYSHHGFFKSAEDESQVAESCAMAQPKLVLVALGVPKQEKWIARYAPLFLPGTVFLGIGGSLDVWSGRLQRAPKLMRALNLEWLYRIATEPWRIRRISKTLPMFVVKVLLSRKQT